MVKISQEDFGPDACGKTLSRQEIPPRPIRAEISANTGRDITSCFWANRRMLKEENKREDLGKLPSKGRAAELIYPWNIIIEQFI